MGAFAYWCALRIAALMPFWLKALGLCFYLLVPEQFWLHPVATRSVDPKLGGGRNAERLSKLCGPWR